MTQPFRFQRAALCTMCGMLLIGLSGCASLAGAGSDSPKPERTITERTPSEVVTAPRKDRESALRLARMLVSQGRLEGAIGVYAELDRKGGMDAKTLLEYAGIASLMEPPRATLPLFVRAEALVKAEKAELTEAEEGALYTGLGRGYMASARMTDARAALERAVKADATNIAGLNAYGVLLDAEGEHEAAQAQFEKALERSPSNVQVLNNLALSRLGTGDAKGALKALRDAESFNAAGNLTISLNLAFAQFMTGAEDRARETLSGFMNEEQAAEMMKTFAGMKTRIDAGESTLADECLRAAAKLVEIRPKSEDDGDYGYEVPVVIEPVKAVESTSGGLSPRAKTLPKDAVPADVRSALEKAAPAAAAAAAPAAAE